MFVNYANLHAHILLDALNSNDYCNYCEQASNWIIWAGEDSSQTQLDYWAHYLAWRGHNAWLTSLVPDFFVLTGNLFTGF